jgi:membrane glycosyltransferase
MVPVTQDHVPKLPQQALRERFLPQESPLLMSTQQLRDFQPKRPGARVPAYMHLRRAIIFLSTILLTVAGCYEMYEVVQVGGVTVLEWMVLVLFVILFAWIAFSFSSALAGFVVLLLSSRDPLGIEPTTPLPPLASRNAMLLPTYNEDPYRIMARLRAMHESIGQIGYHSNFDWFVLSDTTDPATWMRNAFCGFAAKLGRRMSITAIVARTPLENPATSKTG